MSLNYSVSNNFAGSNDLHDKNVTVGHDRPLTRFTAMRASLLCYPATRFESGSEFVVFVLFYWQQHCQITIYPTSPRLGKLVRASTIDQVEKAMLMVIWVKLWYCITKILELCDEFIPGDPPEFFFDRWFWQLLVRKIFNQISKKICISYFVSASFFFRKTSQH